MNKNTSSGRQVISYVGFLLALLVFTLIMMVALLYISPGTSILGVTSVTARQVYTTYTADNIPGIRDVLNSRNIIIESSFIDIDVRVRMANQQDEGSIQVWENSSGLSFNSVKRTHVEWAQVIVPREHVDEITGKVTYTGELYYKITIVEPKGIVSRSDDSCVIINMYATDENSPVQAPFNFILKTGNSNVKFASDNNSVLLRNPLNVGTLEIAGARGNIYLPPAPAGTSPASFYVNVGDVIVDTKSAVLNCESPVSGDVSVKCSSGTYNFRDVGGNVSVKSGSGSFSFRDVGGDVNIEGNCSFGVYGVGGDVKAAGSSVTLKQTSGIISGDVDFNSDNGLLSIIECRKLKMMTVNAGLSVSGKIFDLNYESTGKGGVDVAQIKGGNEARVKTLNGNIKLRKVWPNTFIESRFGAISVDFDASIVIGGGNEPSLTVRSYDGNITANNICGQADINVSALGNANISAGFRQVKGVSSVVYEGSTNPKRNKGEISVTFVSNIKFCIMNIDRMASAHNRISLPMITTATVVQEIIAKDASFVNGASYYVNYANRGGDESTGNLRISTSNKFNLYSQSA